jgi:hypothetical protein
MQVVFWFVTQPTNRVWLRHEHLGTSGARSFAISRAQQSPEANSPTQHWQSMRNRWEYSHLLRAVLSVMRL